MRMMVNLAYKLIQMSSSYYVPTTDKSLGSVKSSVLAVGVSLLFVYLVALHPLRSTTVSSSS